MSLIPYLTDDPWLYRPSLVLPEERQLGLFNWNWNDYWREMENQLARVEKDLSIQVDRDKFQANIDVQQFKPDEISVKLTGKNKVVVEGKHEEKPDEHGYISRHFVRTYVLPENCDVQGLQSKLSSDGVLTITAPKKPEGGKQLEYKEIPIQRSGRPLKKIQNRPKQQQQGKKVVQKK